VSRQNFRLVLGLLAIVIMFKACDRDSGQQTRQQERAEVVAKEVDEELTPQKTVEAREGLAAAIAIDVSGSMDEEVPGENKRKEPKIDIARRAALELVEQFASYARDHQDEPVLLGVYEFSRRRGEPDCRTVVPMGPPDRERAAAAIARLDADGGTPIGQAMITAKRALDETGLSRRHLLVVTDGENTDGVAPDRVAVAIGKRPDAERPSIYFVAFDVEASRFSRVRDAGGLVLSAANATELNSTLDMLLRGKILVEK
jgi:Ca-activated chloride channel homolog